MEDEPEYEQYGLTEEEWEALSKEDQDAYRAVGEAQNMTIEIEEVA